MVWVRNKLRSQSPQGGELRQDLDLRRVAGNQDP